LRHRVSRDEGILLVPAERRIRVEVRVELKPGILDAEADSVQKSLALLGIADLRRVVTARVYDLEFDGISESAARARAQEAVDRLLANPVIHRVSVRPLAD
jgi:phosphoribosylformylglycinamidine synthase PurS subunit